ncbi:ABC transporter ATP-binding protein [Litoreibacter janthinus]|uniref:Putative ABC transport system ATP-binding protein n=1 Tax=Litoreibacter janthinus TaxID=670154 RepID=A0A1I6GCY5_9RHOB|nr:ABC transporter ATP-binding protein [Litoreibacter janthinus]SFR40046.1 putative ABC transport system ATP-binding protein [Litoreibacter janthinus]
MNSINTHRSFQPENHLQPVDHSQTGASVVRFNNICKSYTMDRVEVNALLDVSGEIARRETTFITGPSGSGKSTLLNIMGLIDQPTSGELIILDQDVTNLSDKAAADFRSEHIGFIFQSFNLIPVLTVGENVEFPLLRRIKSASKRREKAKQYLDAVGLADLFDRRPGEISGGQRQRVAIARALVTEPTLIIADEPTANLDSQTSREIIALLDHMKSEFDTSVVICTHDTSLITQGSATINIIDGRTA